VVTASETRYKPYDETRTGSARFAGLTARTYTGQVLNADSGLIYCGARWYDPYPPAGSDGIVPDPASPQRRKRFTHFRTKSPACTGLGDTPVPACRSENQPVRT